MFNRIRKQLNPASLLALAALFVALGGVSYAAATIHGSDIVNRSIAGKKLKNATITGAKVKANAIGGAKIKESSLGQVPSAANAQQAQQAVEATNAQNAVSAQSAVSAQTAASVGPEGVDTAALADDAVTSAKLANTVRRGETVAVADDATELISASCEAGERRISGGGIWGGAIDELDAAGLHVVHSFPGTANNWSVRVYNNSGAGRSFTAYALCLAP